MELRLNLFGIQLIGKAQSGKTGAVPNLATGNELLELSSQTPDAAMAQLGTSLAGLDEATAETRLEEYGQNEVAHEHHKSAVRRLLELFLTPLSVLLLALATVNYFTGEIKGAIVIAVMVVLSSLLSFMQEFRSSKAAERLRAMVSTTATVFRKEVPAEWLDRSAEALGLATRASPTSRVEIPLTGVVPGDIIHLSAGDIVPADVRMLSAKDMFVNQASLTGESLPVEKFVAPLSGASSALELNNMAFMGTNVISGTAVAMVVATGGRPISAASPPVLQANRFRRASTAAFIDSSGSLIRSWLVMVRLAFLVNGFTKGDWLEAFLFAVAVAVGLTPEMLPMIVTINLAKGAMAMASKKVIVKRLNSIQNLGAMNVCARKRPACSPRTKLLEKHRRCRR